MRQGRMNHSRAFTLIEVLVVVAIIALLVSILIPALTRAKDQARRAVCAAHQHQVLLGINSYANENLGLGPQRGWKSYTLSEAASEINGWGGSTKILCNLGQLYKKWIGGQEDVLYCPSVLKDTKNAPYTPNGGTPGSGSGWRSLYDSTYTYTFGGYNYGVPLAQKNDPKPGPSKSPNFRGANPFPQDVWSGFMRNWVENEWVPAHAPLTKKDFKVPTAPALAFDWYIAGTPPHSMGTGINVLYTDGHVRFQRQQGGTSSQGTAQIRIWYELSIKQ